jgi:hypothetical protein
MTFGAGECMVTALWSTTGDRPGSCAADWGSTLSVASVSVTDVGLPARYLTGGRVTAMTRLRGGDYWIAETAVLTFDCKSMGSGAYPSSSNLLCSSVEEK